MNTKKLFYLLLIALILLSAAACQKFKAINVTTDSRGTYFSIEDDVVKEKNIIVLSIEVGKQDCEKNCLMWEAYRSSNEASKIGFVAFPIRYGATIEGLTPNHPPLPLIGGKYYIAATFSAMENEKQLETIKVHNTFVIEK